MPPPRSTTLRRLLVVGLALVWFILFRPTTLGGPATYVFVSGTSMLPALAPGDLLVAMRADSVGTGDIVVFPADGGLVVHRIVGGDAASGYVVQGDNRSTTDLWRPTGPDIVGTVRLRVPAVGRFVRALAQPPLPAIGAAVVAFLVVATGGSATRPRPLSP